MHDHRIANDAYLVRHWYVAGNGFVVKSCLDMSAHLLSGRLVSMMPAFKPESLVNYANTVCRLNQQVHH